MGSYPERYKGKFSSYEVTKLLDRIQPPAIKEAVQRSTREIVIAMAEPTMVESGENLGHADPGKSGREEIYWPVQSGMSSLIGMN